MEIRTSAVFAWRVVATHVVSYFACGLLASLFFNYTELYQETELRYLMRPTNSVWVAAGPALQLLRGLLFAAVLWPIADRIVGKRGTWLLYGLMLGLAVLGTAGPAPGSLEGIIFTKLPLRVHLVGLPEVVVQTALFSLLLVAWSRKPARWMNVVAACALAAIALMSLAGVLAALGIIKTP